jgi:cell division septum initiation protein DivIVA
LYEEPDRPQNALDYIKNYLGGPSSNDGEALRQENEQLKQKIKELTDRLKVC